MSTISVTSDQSAAGERLSIVVNGEPAWTAARDLSGLLEEMGFAGMKVATALNGDFVPERQRRSVALSAGDRVEIVAPRQGG